MKRKIENPNTPKLWDKILFEQNNKLIQSAIYLDKIDKVLKFIRKKNGNFLDIGFGRGNLERKIVGHRLNIQIYGIDFSPKTVAVAKKEIQGKFIVGNIFKLPFKKSFFDIVTILDVLEHIEKGRVMSALKEVYRVTKTDGSLIISVPLNENLKMLNSEERNYNAHLREYDLSQLKKELNNSGFDILKHEYLYAFRKFYKPKSFVIKFATFLKKPNLLIVYCKKR